VDGYDELGVCSFLLSIKKIYKAGMYREEELLLLILLHHRFLLSLDTSLILSVESLSLRLTELLPEITGLASWTVGGVLVSVRLGNKHTQYYKELH
jgi:hypothetical protein